MVSIDSTDYNEQSDDTKHWEVQIAIVWGWLKRASSRLAATGASYYMEYRIPGFPTKNITYIKITIRIGDIRHMTFRNSQWFFFPPTVRQARPCTKSAAAIRVAHPWGVRRRVGAAEFSVRRPGSHRDDPFWMVPFSTRLGMGWDHQEMINKILNGVVFLWKIWKLAGILSPDIGVSG